jgi:glutamyl-Q tRNA(Asp) synthetase
LARGSGGAFLLRIEDIDPGRTREEHAAGIEEDLAWLGIDWDGPVVRQSERLHLYRAALERLRERGLVYPCFCTRSGIAAEIARSAAAPHGPEGAVYPGTCRPAPSAPSHPGFPRPDPDLVRPHAWRLDVRRAVELAGTLAWTDATAGEIIAHPERFGDVVLARKDAPTSYHLAVTIDDAAQGVTDVVRGRDLFAATDVHRLLQALLGLPVPRYHHHELLTAPDGRRLAKRSGAPSLLDLRLAGADPEKLRDELLGERLPAGYLTAAS